MSIVTQNLGAFITLSIAFLSMVGTMIGYLFNLHYDYKKHKEEFAKNLELTLKNIAAIEEIKNMLGNMETKILLKVAEQDKEILLKVLEQETRNNAESRAAAKVYGDIEKSLALIRSDTSGMQNSIEKFSQKIESMEHERMQELKEKIIHYTMNKNNPS